MCLKQHERVCRGPGTTAVCDHYFTLATLSTRNDHNETHRKMMIIMRKRKNNK